MSDYVDNFRSLPTATLKQRLATGRLPQKAADAYTQVLTERASYVPVDLCGAIYVSGHSGCYYVSVDEGQKVSVLFASQRNDDYLIDDDLVEKHGLDDRDKIIFQLGPDMTWVTEIKSVTKAPFNKPVLSVDGYSKL